MPIELCMLVWTALLCLLLVGPYVVGNIGQLGLVRLAGNREELPQLEGWIGRARRTHLNHVENLAPFAVLVLVAHATGALDSTTALASQIFLGSRVVHAVSYLAGIPWLRTLAFGAGVAAEVAIALRIFAHA